MIPQRIRSTKSNNNCGWNGNNTDSRVNETRRSKACASRSETAAVPNGSSDAYLLLSGIRAILVHFQWFVNEANGLLMAQGGLFVVVPEELSKALYLVFAR